MADVALLIVYLACCVGEGRLRQLNGRSEGEPFLMPAGRVVPGAGSTDLFIFPGFDFRVVRGLLTNFHLPRSSLVMLVSAFGGREAVMAAYAAAIAEGYRFYSYGDAMLIL